QVVAPVAGKDADPFAPGSGPMSAAVTYRPRNAEENPLYGVIAEHLETFLSRQRERDRTCRNSWSGFRSFLDCGVFDRGLACVHCNACGWIVVILCGLFSAPPGVPAAIARQQFLGKIDLPLLLAVVFSFNAAALADFV